MVQKGGGQGRHRPPQILAYQKAPPAAPARRITACPPRFLDFETCLYLTLEGNGKIPVGRQGKRRGKERARIEKLQNILLLAVGFKLMTSR